MSIFQFANNARSLLAGAISDSDLSFSVAGGEGSRFPASGPFRVMLTKATGVREIVEVESRSTDAFTIMTGGRGLEGTSAQTYSSGDVTSGVSVRLVATAGVFERFLQRLASTYTGLFDFTALTANRTISFPDSSGAVMMQGDATYGFTTGDAKITFKTAADPGWVMANDGTLGNAASGATTRANADTEALFTLLWNNTANADCPVSGGRGASAAADFAANKTLAIPKALGRALAIAGAGAGLTARALGSIVGTENHTLTAAQSGLKGHGHTASSSAGGGGPVNVNVPVYETGEGAVSIASTPASTPNASVNVDITLDPHDHPVTVNAAAGENAAESFPLLSQRFHMNVMIKL